MAATSGQEESSTSSSSLPPRNYDVFLSFRGEDTRKNFTDHLYAALVRHGFTTFRDDNDLERGEEIGPELVKAIEGSSVAVVVLSINYADSRWCLEELVTILDCKRTFKQKVLPVFYNVEPSHVRAQKESFGEGFAKLEERYKDRGMEGKLQKWRAALTEASNLSGFELQKVANGHESQFILEIVKHISNKLNLPYLHVAYHPVGMESRVQQVSTLLSLGSDAVRMVGICGIGGLGKSTIAKAIFNLIHRNFDSSSFLANVRENSKQPNGLVHLQERLLFDILKSGNQTIRDVDTGIEVIKQRLWCRKVLVVLDDVDNINQLNALAITHQMRVWLRSKSRIIITTRDESLLTQLGVDGVCKPELFTCNESLQLFNWHAFRNNHPREDYVELSSKVVGYAGGLPLALEVLGSSLVGKSVPQWERELKSLEMSPHDDIQSKLKVSFDSLNDDQKELFLDIACFFVGMDQNYAIKILERHGFLLEVGLEVLSRRCLVRIEQGLLTMHDLLRDMGREIVRKEHKETGKRSRLWFQDDVHDVLRSHLGTEAVEGLVLNLPRSNDVLVNAEAFAPMNRLRLLVLNYVNVRGSYVHLSKRLAWLCWFGFPLKSIPSDLFMENLVAIEMRYSSLKQVWKGRKNLSRLKILNLSHSYHLIETPDLSEVNNLEMLLLNNCTRLVKVHQSIECLNKLVALDLRNCINLEKLPPGIGNLTSLQNLSLFGCSRLDKPLVFKESPSKSWFSLFSTRSSPLGNPDSISISLASIMGLICLKILNLANCILSHVPDKLGGLISLEHLNVRGNTFCTLPSSINNLARLQLSRLNQCTRLQSPSLTFSGCDKLVVNNIASNFRKNLLQNQELSAIGGFKILSPGDAMPSLFNYQSVGSVLSFVVSLHPDWKIQGWILCVVLAGCMDELVAEEVEYFNYPLLYLVKNKTKGFERRYQSAFDDIPESTLQDHMWLHYAPQHYLELQIDPGDKVEYSIIVTDHTEFLVKKCGVNLIYDGDEKEDQAMVQYASSSYRDVIFDKDVLADQVVDENKIVAGGTGSDDPTQRSAPSTLNHGKPSGAEKGKTVVVESSEHSPTCNRRRTKGIVIEEIDVHSISL